MNYKCLAMVGALVMSAPVASAATAVNLTEVGKINASSKINSEKITADFTVIGQVFSLAAGSYVFSLSPDAENGQKIEGSLTAVLKGLTYAFEKSLTIDFGSNPKTSKPLSFDLVQAGDFTIDWSGDAKRGTFGAAASIRGNTVAVPGPEAGAGIGALAMAGVAYAVSRRKKARAAA